MPSVQFRAECLRQGPEEAHFRVRRGFGSLSLNDSVFKISGVWISVTNANIVKMERMSAGENVSEERRKESAYSVLRIVQSFSF